MRVWTTLRASFAAAALALALTPHPAAAAQPATRPADRADRPNVVVIVTDDQGSVDAGCYGVTDLVTPNIDALAARGVRFTQFYAAAPLCSPSRAALLTGKTPQRAGLPGQAASQAGGGGMPAAQTTMAEVYKAAGYATGHVGKWHLGYDRGTMPLDQGFDSSFGFMGGCIDNYSHFYYWGGPNAHDLWRDGQEVWDEGQFFGDLVVNESGRFIAANKDKPFFLYVAINMPHYPLQGIAKWRERYKELPSPRDKYAAAMSTADEQIGGVLAALDAGGLRENTIVVYMSDHGHSTEVRGFGGGGNAGPYRGAKFSLFEGGIRVPAVISWPGHLPEGEVRGQMVVGVDWLPTTAELSGVRAPDDLDGKSVTGVIASGAAASPHDSPQGETFCWATANAQWAVREGKWKLVGNPIDPTTRGPVPTVDGMFLSDLSSDVGERTNVAADHPDVVERLRKRHEAWKLTNPNKPGPSAAAGSPADGD